MRTAQARHIAWADREVAVPAFLVCAVMPMTTSPSRPGPGGGANERFLACFLIGPMRELLGVH